MPPIVLVAGAVAGVAFWVLIWLFASSLTPAGNRVAAENLKRGLHTEYGDSARADVGSRGFARVARIVTPPGFVTRIDSLLSRAGRPPAWPLPRVLAGKLVLAAAGAVLTLLNVIAAPSPMRVVLAVVVTTVAYFVPELLLHSEGQKRQATIQLELPDTLDQLTIAVEAGLGFEAAMMRAGQNGKGPLGEELIRTLQDIQVGQPRRDAYLALAGRTTVVDLRRFLRAVIQSDTYGVAVANVLRTQSKEMRLKRRQRAEEKAMQIPVKVIFPLMLCILPTLFIVLLGPAVMGIISAFK